MGTVILAEGSSTTQGWCDTECRGYLSRIDLNFMTDFMERRAPYRTIINLAAANRILPTMIEHLPANVAQYGPRNTPGNGVIGLFQLGRSEAVVPKGGVRPRVPLCEFNQHMQRLGDMCLRLGVRQLFVGAQPVDGTAGGMRFEARRIDEYNAAVRDYAEQVAAPFIEPVVLTPELIAVDGVHPNSEGHKRMATIVGAALVGLCSQIEAS